jgi:hypothetical protein
MNTDTRNFLNRIFKNNKTKWWHDLASETPKRKYGDSARFLETTLQEELDDYPEYRQSNRSMYFFSKSPRSSIDGRFRSLGVEEKFNPLDLKEHLIDGAIHRGLIWTLGKPQSTSESTEAVSIYVIKKGSVPMNEMTTDLFIPVLVEMAKIGVYVVFVNGETGDYWHANSDKADKLPSWLSNYPQPNKWDLKLNQMNERNEKALSLLQNKGGLNGFSQRHLTLPFMGKKGEFQEYTDGSTKIAVMDYGNQWRLIELGLLLRSLGYDAVKVIYNKTKHKNSKDRIKDLIPAGMGVEKRVAADLASRYAIHVDWKVRL